MTRNPLLERLLGQMRRLNVLAVCAILAASQVTETLPALLAAGLGALCFGALVLIAIPAWRQALEVAGIGAVLASVAPLPIDMLPGIWLGLSALSYVLLYGSWHNRPALRLNLETRRRISVPGSPAAVWRRVVPGASHPADHWSGKLIDFDADKDDLDTLYLRFRTADGLFEEASIAFLEKTKPLRCRYLIERANAAGTDEAEVTLTISQNPDDGGCTVETVMIQPELPPGIALARWFDEVDAQADGTGALIHARRKLSLPMLSRRGSARQGDGAATGDAEPEILPDPELAQG
ncbi:hypothetical protein [Roseisalinus antarcticus]|uniref:Uncharacterized protein n=1 Tax=Roseisalinus antarcticus TaxID=254357 RepID=A0A1Y5T272_9RHOB|nr:hypothetical protein [Roseisalinus antarcticus]SLN53896.1 hypothetical protein ROA7023_02391 [Roseisalinus antarcticus]